MTRFLLMLALSLSIGWTSCTPIATDPIAESEGVGTYQERLEATAEQFAYYSLLDQNLTKTIWETAGISLRVPLPFQEVPLDQDPSGPPEPPQLKNLLGVPLPGVMAMWQAQLPGKEPSSTHTAYMILLSNFHLWPNSRRAAMGFHQSLVNNPMGEWNGRPVFPIEAQWDTENSLGYGLPYTTGTFQAQLQDPDLPADCTLYLFQHGANNRHDEMKVALLFIVPQEAVFAGSLAEVNPKDLTAQSLRIKPRQLDTANK